MGKESIANGERGLFLREWDKEGVILASSSGMCFPEGSLFSVGTIKEALFWDFPGGPAVRTSPSKAGGAGLIPGQRTKIPHASQPKNQNIKQKPYCNKFNKDFKNGPH